MAFPSSITNDFDGIGSGERYGNVNIALTSDNFEDGLKIGKFSQLSAGKLMNMNGNAGSVVAGVVLRNVAAPIEDGATVNGSLYNQVDYMRQGMVTVDVKVGEIPAKFGAVFADETTGEAVTAAGIAVRGEFIEKVSANVWLIRLF